MWGYENLDDGGTMERRNDGSEHVSARASFRRSSVPPLLLALAVLGVGCRGRPAATATGSSAESRLAHLVDSLRASVEKSTGLTFKAPPRSAVRSRDQLRAYLVAKLDEDLPPERARGVETAYRLFGMLPDTVEIRPLMLDLLTEQIVGFYDPDSAMLFGVGNAPEDQLKVMAAHELVHALQGQYLPLDSILTPHGDNDRTSAAQAVLEGQAMVASIRAITPGVDVIDDPSIWETFKETARNAQSAMPRFAAAPLVVREALIFPYIQGADFIRWWGKERQGVPFGATMPVSTEQVLHPDRYARGDQPLRIVFDSAGSDPVMHEDALGEVEVRILGAALLGRHSATYTPPVGWAGDRYRVVSTAAGPALVWYIAFDDAPSADRFRASIGQRLAALQRDGYRVMNEPVTLAGKPADRFVIAPVAWTGWGSIPVATAGL